MIAAKFQSLESGRTVINVSNIFRTALEIFIASGQGKRAERYSSKALWASLTALQRLSRAWGHSKKDREESPEEQKEPSSRPKGWQSGFKQRWISSV